MGEIIFKISSQMKLVLFSALTIINTGVLIFTILFRNESLLIGFGAFFISIWLIVIPGILIIEIFSENKSLLVTFVEGAGVGLAYVPFLFYLIRFAGYWQKYTLFHSVGNLILLLIYVRLKKYNQFKQYLKINLKTAIHIMMIVFVVLAFVSTRETTQLRPPRLEIKTTQEVDAGYLMGLVAAMKNHGTLVDIHNNNNSFSYHHFVYLVMALVSSASGASVLTVFQLIFPVILFILFGLSVYIFVRSVWQRAGVALVSAFIVFFLADFSILNQFLKKLVPSLPPFFYSTMITKNTHLSPSQLVSIVILFIILFQLHKIKVNNTTNFAYVILVMLSVALCGYKASTWLCVTAGLFFTSLVLFKKNRRLFYTSLAVGLISLIVLIFVYANSDVDQSSSSFGFAYPLLSNKLIQKVGIPEVVAYSQLTIPLVILVIIVFPIWFILTFGVRLFWLVDQIKNIRQSIKTNDCLNIFIVAAVFVGLAAGLMISSSAFGRVNTLYFILFGMFCMFPMAFPYLLMKMKRWNYAMVIFGILISLQTMSGMFSVVEPFIGKANIATLSTDWFAAMNYLKRSTSIEAKLIINRFGLSNDRKYDNYKEKFYFIPAISERTVVVSGNGYGKIRSADLVKLSQKVDQIFQSNNKDLIKKNLLEIGADYVIIDRQIGLRPEKEFYELCDKVLENNAIQICMVPKDKIYLKLNKKNE